EKIEFPTAHIEHENRVRSVTRDPNPILRVDGDAVWYPIRLVHDSLVSASRSVGFDLDATNGRAECFDVVQVGFVRVQCDRIRRVYGFRKPLLGRTAARRDLINLAIDRG